MDQIVEQTIAPIGAEDEPALAAALARVCARALPPPVAVTIVERYSGGSSRETFAFDATDGEGRVHALVMRRNPPPGRGAPDTGIAVDRAAEFRLFSLALAAGIPSPRPLCAFVETDGLGEGFVMTRVPGTAIARKLLRDGDFARARERIPRQIGAILARLHAIDTASLPALATLTVADQIDQQQRLLDLFGEPHPVFELALSWLRRHRPAGTQRFALVHGDFRTGNFMADGDGVSAILDWELAHIGDPQEDLAWFCIKAWRFGNLDLPAGGFGTREVLFDAYEAEGGTLDRSAVKFWEIYSTLRWGIICLAQAQTHLSGAQRSIELAVIGRRAAETEHDLLQLIEER